MDSTDVLEQRLTGSTASRFWRELSTNSGHFPIANITFEVLREGLLTYARAPDLYAIVGAGFLQTAALVRWQGRRWPWLLLGNLLGPIVYTAVETLFEGARFFSAPQHIAYWVFASAIGASQAIRVRSGRYAPATLVIEHLARTALPFVLYALFEGQFDGTYRSVFGFFGDPSHAFIGLTLLLLGLLLGFASVLADRNLRLLRATTAELQTYAEWLLGPSLLRRAIAEPSALALRREQRSVLFSDVRGFTSWSERHDPAEVLDLLTAYYKVGEDVLQRHGAIRVKFAADELMAPFPTAEAAAAAGLALQNSVAHLLARAGLASGIGIHTGFVIEGVLGAQRVRAYDVIGDTVNTAKRIEGAATGGEVLVSAATVEALGPSAIVSVPRTIVAKGKDEPVVVYTLSGLNMIGARSQIG